MDNKTLAYYIGTDVEIIDKLRNMDAETMYHHPDYQRLIASVDKRKLDRTLPLAKEAYANGLDKLKVQLTIKYRVDAKPMSAYTLASWVVGILDHPNRLSDLIQMHDKIPGRAIVDSLDTLVDILDTLPEGKDTWQRALCLLTMPLMQHD